MLLSFPINLSAESKKFTIQGDHGKLSTILQTPKGEKEYPIVILLHGFNAGKDYILMKDLANALEKEGIASIRFDFNGQGESEGRFEDMTILNEIHDAKKVYEYVTTLPNITSISLAGHSQGGVVAGMLAGELGEEKIKAVALIAAAPVLQDDIVRGNLFGVVFDPVNLPDYIIVPIANKKVGKAYLEVVKDLPIYEVSQKYKGKVFIIHGTGDTLVPYTNSLQYHRIYPKSKIILLPGKDHFFKDDNEEAIEYIKNFFVDNL